MPEFDMQAMKSRLWFSLILPIFIVLLCSCGTLPTLPFSSHTEPTQTLPPLSSSTPIPLSSPQTQTATPTPTPPPASQVTLAAGLQSTLLAELPPTLTPDSTGFSVFSGIQSVRLIPLGVLPGEQPLWAAYTQGERSYQPAQNHYIAIYAYDAAGWRQLSRLELGNPDSFGPNAVAQVHIEPTHIWLQVQSGVGAHGGCFDLLQFDRAGGLQDVISSCSSSPKAGELRDLDGDGIPEVVLDWSEDYVLCYACGVRIPSYQVWRLDGARMVEVTLRRISSDAGQAVQLNNRAVDLAQAELWKEAEQTIKQADALDSQNETIGWNAILINLQAAARAQAITSSAYPLLSQIFYGDYPAALKIVQALHPRDVFNQQTPLVVDTVVDDNREALKDWIMSFTDKALQAEPDLAAAYFLRGWALYIWDPPDRNARVELQRAVELDRANPYFVQSRDFVNTYPWITPTPTPIRNK
jgi:hypothetical protein